MTDLLFDRAQSFLAVIDVQDVFLAKLAETQRSPLVARIAWLVRVAAALDIPVLAMGEDIPRNGAPVAEVTAALPAGTAVHNKRVFGLFGQPDIRAAVRAAGRAEALLVGLETDVCVAQSALGLHAAGYRVGVVTDATGAPGGAHQSGLDRMRAAGVTLLSAKALYYEWLRDLDLLSRVKPLVDPYRPGDLVL